ncbi:MAG TPA: hypothetical protein VJN18_32600 [Polyangiaceae bacterium]|nr:hypothetical protein [Polyangiaceae bacterium]
MATQKVKLRPVVQWFAEQMERKLRENDHKGGWDADNKYSLMNRIGQELRELRAVARKYAELHFGDTTREQLAERGVREAADVANMAMMVADHFRNGGPSKDQGKTL